MWLSKDFNSLSKVQSHNSEPQFVTLMEALTQTQDQVNEPAKNGVNQ